MRCAWLAVLVACAPTETGNPATLSLSAHTSDPSVAELGSGTGLRIEQAWVGLGDVRFARAAECDDVDIEAQIAGPVVSDLADQPVELLFDGDEASYCEVRVAFRRVADVTARPADLLDHSIYIAGMTRNDVPFVLRSRMDPELEVESEGAPFGVLMPLVLSFDVARWFAGMDVDGGELVGGAIRIDEANNEELLDLFEDNVEDTLELYEDLDGDGRRDDDEPRIARSRAP